MNPSKGPSIYVRNVIKRVEKRGRGMVARRRARCISPEFRLENSESGRVEGAVNHAVARCANSRGGRKRKRGRKRWRWRDLRAILTGRPIRLFSTVSERRSRSLSRVCNPFRWKWDPTGCSPLFQNYPPSSILGRNSQNARADHYIRSADVYRARLLELYLHWSWIYHRGSFESRATFGTFSLSRGNSKILDQSAFASDFFPTAN